MGWLTEHKYDGRRLPGYKLAAGMLTCPLTKFSIPMVIDHLNECRRTFCVCVNMKMFKD